MSVSLPTLTFWLFSFFPSSSTLDLQIRQSSPSLLPPFFFLLQSYLLGVHDPSTNTLTLAPTPAYLLSHSVKRLKDLKPMENPDEENANRIEARNKLGEAFGTKKSKSRIKTAERNKIDTAGMEGMRNQLEESILVAGKDLPSQGECQTKEGGREEG